MAHKRKQAYRPPSEEQKRLQKLLFFAKDELERYVVFRMWRWGAGDAAILEELAELNWQRRNPATAEEVAVGEAA